MGKRLNAFVINPFIPSLALFLYLICGLILKLRKKGDKKRATKIYLYEIILKTLIQSNKYLNENQVTTVFLSFHSFIVHLYLWHLIDRYLCFAEDLLHKREQYIFNKYEMN